MDFWQKSRELLGEHYSARIKLIYASDFPLVVRVHLASFIEEKFWFNRLPVPSEPGFSTSISKLINQFIDKVESFDCTDEDRTLKPKLNNAARFLRKRFGACPMRLFNVIQESLTLEMLMLEDDYLDIQCNIGSKDASDILCKLESVKRRTEIAADFINKLKQAAEAFYRKWKECADVNAELQLILPQQTPDPSMIDLMSKKEYAELEMNRMIAVVTTLRLEMTQGFDRTITIIKDLYKQIIDDQLAKWKRKQQLAGNGYPFPDNLDQIEDWCVRLAEVTLLSYQQVEEVENIRAKLALDNPALIDTLPSVILPDVANLLHSLFISCFVIEKHPPQVLNGYDPFSVSLRLLLGDKVGLHHFPPTVTASIITEPQSLMFDDLEGPMFVRKAGTIINDIGFMEFKPATKQLSATLGNMQLSTLTTVVNKYKETASHRDEKFLLLFESQFSVDKKIYRIWTLSLPVLIVEHMNEECDSWATVTWDNAFKTVNRRCCFLLQRVPWIRIKGTLSRKFQSITGRGLNEDNMRCLSEKIYDNPWITYGRFYKERIPGRSFTFWQWFYSNAVLIKTKFLRHWEDGAIVGFVAKITAEKMLATCQTGTFLLRFSDSVLGAITIAWVSEFREIVHLQPFTADDFATRSLPDMINDLSELKFVYPNVPKETYFKKYYTPLPNEGLFAQVYKLPTNLRPN